MEHGVGTLINSMPLLGRMVFHGRFSEGWLTGMGSVYFFNCRRLYYVGRMVKGALMERGSCSWSVGASIWGALLTENSRERAGGWTHGRAAFTRGDSNSTSSMGEAAWSFTKLPLTTPIALNQTHSRRPSTPPTRTVRRLTAQPL